ncbi:MAG: sigma 54-interacting transcriptional regulator [Clostridiales Family XIII bacterium]|jgi:PAS domain S-box-containing protein|nr:sigma 54-interacting transcriptional regulator [Clostridiales Family XIII bacterium]
MSYNPFYNIENPELIGYEYAWVDFFKNGEVNETIIRNDILASWERCLALHPDAAAREIKTKFCPPGDFAKKLAINEKYLEISEAIIVSVMNALKEKHIGVYITDRDGIVLKMVCEDTEAPCFGAPQTDLSEEYAGTNCMDLAVRHGEPTSVIGAQHYFHHFHRYAGYAAPIKDINGEMRGAIGILATLEHMSGYMLSIAATAATAIENGIGLFRSNDAIQRQNEEKQDILDSITDGIIYVDKNLNISYTNLQFLKFIGLEKSSLVGQAVGIISMKPDINTLVGSGSSHTNMQVKLNGDGKSYKCLLSHHPGTGVDGSTNEIFIFTAINEIREMAEAAGNDQFFTFESLIGKSKAFLECIDRAKKAADYGARVILEGESGTGKELFAQAIHNGGSRQDEPFIAIDCGAIPHELFESELFGFEEGAFTGAQKGGHIGKFEQAHYGTLFLDEIVNLPLDMQAKLLRVLQDSRIVRIGGHKSIRVDVQIIAATNVDLLEEVGKGNFREDLYYRLNVVHIKLPSLRERKEDIPILVNHFIQSNSLKSSIRSIDNAAMKIFCGYSWPGNIRQLNNILERIMLFAEGKRITADMLPQRILQNASSFQYENIYEEEKVADLNTVSVRYAKNVCRRFNGNIKRTAEALRVSRSTVYRLLKTEEGLVK